MSIWRLANTDVQTKMASEFCPGSNFLKYIFFSFLNNQIWYPAAKKSSQLIVKDLQLDHSNLASSSIAKYQPLTGHSLTYFLKNSALCMEDLTKFGFSFLKSKALEHRYLLWFIQISGTLNFFISNYWCLLPTTFLLWQCVFCTNKNIRE